MSIDPESASAALLAAREGLFARANVVATGVGYKVTGGRRTDELSIVCSVEAKIPQAQLASRDLVPESIGGVPTDVVATGRLRALHDPKSRWRPAPGGVSIGHRDVSAGTLGCLVRRGEETFVLSNNHVLAASNAGAEGDAILQPAVYDGGSNPEDCIATLAEFVPLRWLEEDSGCGIARAVSRGASALARAVGSGARLRAVSQEVRENLVDAALARPLAADLVSAEVAEVGEIAGVASAELGTAVKKSGRTTGLTTGEIVQIEVTADIWYDDRVARFTDQLMADGMSQGGDSGSAVFDMEDQLVGLLFGGGEGATLINRIEHVMDAFGVTV